MKNDRRTLNQLLACGLAEDPNRIALSKNGLTWSFAELDRLSTLAAERMVRAYGLRRGDRVVVLAAGEPAIVVAAIAVWKAGGVYAPIDIENAPKRTELVLEKLKPRLAISTAARLKGAAETLGNLLTFSYEEIMAGSGTVRGESLNAIDPDDDAVIIHTSGSTGVPKGAALTHNSVTTYLRNHNTIIRFNTRSVGMNNGPFHFDVSIQDTFLPLFFGARVVMHDGLFISPIILSLISREGVTHLIAVSSVLDLISQDDARLKALGERAPHTVITGGELCNVKLINRWLTHYPSINFQYGYGPTECNSLCMSYRVTQPDPDRTRPFPIGTVFPGHKAVLVDAEGIIIEEPGRVGTLCLSGPQVMREYIGMPEATAAAIRIIDGERYYVTGDQAWRDSDGLYHFSGRLDTEHKIRGRRIDLMELRNALLACEDVRYAVVGVSESGGEKRIWAFVQTATSDRPSPALIAATVAERVPYYMHPYWLLRATSAPKTRTGKMAEKAIAEACEAAVSCDPNERDIIVSF
jgi:D-alanine--poly(phosphoribitol) ligase subunit 1